MKKPTSSILQRLLGSLGIVLVALLFTAISLTPVAPVLMTQAKTQGNSPLAHLTLDELVQVKHCIQEIKSRQIQSGTLAGALRVANDGTVLVENYFALQSALALLAVTNDGNSEEAETVRKYLVWYATAIDGNAGVAHIYSPDKQNNPGYDSLDSLCGLYLLVSARYYRIKGSLPPEVEIACYKSLQTLNDVIRNKQKVVDNFKSTEAGDVFTLSLAAKNNGLSIDTGRHCQHYLANNVESFGVSESAALFSALGKQAESNLAASLANSIFSASSRFQVAERFAFSINELDAPQDNNASRDLRAYANLYGLAYLPPQYPNLWEQLKATYGNEADLNSDDALQASQAPSELWLIAATRVAPQEATTYWRPRVVNNAKSFNGSTYIGRLAVTVLALVGSKAAYPMVQNTTVPANVAPTLVKMTGPNGVAATVSGTPPLASPLLNGFSSANTFANFTTTVSDANGNANLGLVYFILGSGASELRLTYDAAKNRLNVNGATGSFAPGSTGVLTTSSGGLDCVGTTLTRNGNEMSITWRLKITSASTLKQGLRLQAQDKAGARSAVLSLGSWTFSSASNLAPTLVSMAGPSGATATASGTPPVVSPLLNGQSPVNTFVNFTTTVRDGNGNSDLDSIYFILGSGAKEVRLTYSAATNRLSAPGGSPGSFAPGNTSMLTTLGGVLDCATTKVIRNGNELTILWSLKVTSAVKQGLRLQVQDKANVRSPALGFGSWTFTTSAASSAASALTAPSGENS